MSDGKQTRLQFTKAEKRAMAGDAKTKRLRACGSQGAIARPERVGDGLEGKDALHRLARCPGKVPNCLSRQP